METFKDSGRKLQEENCIKTYSLVFVLAVESECQSGCKCSLMLMDILYMLMLI